MKPVYTLLIAPLLVLSCQLQAASLKITTSAVSNGGNGGSYTIKILSGPANNLSYNSASLLSSTTLEGFCLEPTEYFSSGGIYDYTIAGFADGGANELVGRNTTYGDQLSLGTTWLYSKFARGVLSPYHYSIATTTDKNARKNSNLLLQRAFWYLEDDYSSYNSVTALTNPYLSLVATKFGSLANAQKDATTGSYGVWALNLTSTDKGGKVTKHQSQLYYQKVPDTASTLALFGVIGAALVAFRRRQA